MPKYQKYIENQLIKKHQYCFANISATKAWIFMKFFVVANYYLVILSFKSYEDPCINARTQVISNVKNVKNGKLYEAANERQEGKGWLWLQSSPFTL